MTPQTEIELLKAQIKDRDETIERFVRHADSRSYGNGYNAGRRSADSSIGWYVQELRRLVALCERHGLEWQEGR